jgi:putative endonuclease
LNHSTRIGKTAEAKAAGWLVQQGLHIITTNFSCRWGEIDIIGKQRDTLIFFEVKYRRSSKFGSAAAQVTISKQHKIIRTARHFLASHPEFADCAMRFDVIILGKRIRQINAAFSSDT